MFLKRIELAGFKSFADKTELEFVRGITAVVGPNGSGKSNISDSIRWVLGEQSAKSLRGGKMEDIIFAGSDARKAVNFAEVSLTLDNTDGALPLAYNEVTVTRRVHRSGDSEYMINKQSCRLKDITELFMDTGIGKEAYSIIGQGRIEEILSTRSEDRRGIFEEASGIVKYKSRKREAQRKLDDTEQNLLRIHDLVSELEAQVEPLREQSEKAIHFKELRDQLKQSEISMYVHSIETVHSSWNESNLRMKKLQEEQLALSTVVSKHDALLEKDRLKLRELEASLDRLHESMLQVSEDYEKCEGYGEVLKERKRNLEQNRTQLENSITSQNERISALAKEEAEFRGKAAVLDNELQVLRLKLQEEEVQLLGTSASASGDAEDSLKSELLDVLSTMAQLRNEIRYASAQEEALQRRMERLGDEHGKWLEQNEKLSLKRSELQQRLEATLAEINSIRNRYIEQSEKLSAGQKLLEEAQTAVRQWEQKLEALRSRRDTMKEMQDDLDGFMQGVREVLKASRRGTGGIEGVHGAVAELIRVPEKVELAIETSLGGALQHIVMSNEKSARAAIAFLKQRQLGRATFLPLDVIRGRNISEQDKRMIAGLEGFVGVAAELVSFDAKYGSIVENLLGNVLISETLEQANRIASKCQYRFRVVTLEGDVVNAGGSMSGGSLQKKGANLLGRQRQIEQLAEDVKTTELQLTKLRDKISDLRKEQSISNQNVDDLRGQGEQRRIEEQQIRAELQQLENESRHLDEQRQLFEADRDGHKSEKQQLVTSATDAEKRLVEVTLEEERLQTAIRLAEERRKAGESAKEQLQDQLTDLKIAVAKTDQEKLNFEDQASRIRLDIGRAKQELSGLRQMLARQQEEAEQHGEESIKQMEQINHLKLQKESCAAQTDLKRAERAEMTRDLEQGENETKDQRTQLRKVEDQLRQTEIAANRLDVELDNLLRKLSEEYELSFELAKERYPVPEDVQSVQNEVRDLKRKISGLGEVNLGAIEEYERVKERYTFLDDQKNDLIEAKTTLYQVIREMDEEMSKRFRTTFEAIRGHFVLVFAKLFGGGRADLIMVEPDRVLDSGIDIVAQPPGKKLQNLQLLSGGERALTAIALLFAILQVKPVPFCVLDEVEAALDEANVARFAQYLREFSELTQFIVVTHRKGTMEEADVLYGVTMEEGGVSKLVSVRLEDEEQYSA
ncbi:chromosome partition protein Smc [Paenibacillus baekrokdamisoli]|uniref:Chromosome partition protein Smc n=1 Tax=Paenibacillus baekrokdamisoli TaxID=1712516 RepID=A0A3G9IXM4_9BACL|nr:chromosome segregation protein SMC [Paenibacillus baekrokdamisoli]MBB3069741.1 chromosome segregation protein [Paenibacillus baekrokdamisoli]BBH20905.1 chromosome partition protein Smc [Paenibacillus baekrokdamisoli]